MRQKINMVYYAANMLGHQISWEKAVRIADAFSLSELTRIYLMIQNTGRRTYDKKVA